MLRRRKTVCGRVDRVKVRKRIEGICAFTLVNGVITPRRVAAWFFSKNKGKERTKRTAREEDQR